MIKTVTNNSVIKLNLEIVRSTFSSSFKKKTLKLLYVIKINISNLYLIKSLRLLLLWTDFL